MAVISILLVIPSMSGGCIIVPAIPLNAPGCGHTYQVVDQYNRPIKDGFLTLHSFYRANEEMFRVYPIENGRAHVPPKVGTRCSVTYWMLLPVWTFYFENPYGTYIYPVSPGHVFDGGWQVAPWDSPDFMDGLSPPPKVLRMRQVSPDTEREDLKGLAYPARIRLQPEKDQAARDALKEYVERRLAELPPAKNVVLEQAIARKDLPEVRRLLDSGADVNIPHLHSLWRPIYWAVLSGDLEIVRLLIQRGARVNVLDVHGRSPLRFARNARTRELLLEHGADPYLGAQATTRPANTDLSE